MHVPSNLSKIRDLVVSFGERLPVFFHGGSLKLCPPSPVAKAATREDTENGGRELVAWQRFNYVTAFSGFMQAMTEFPLAQ